MTAGYLWLIVELVVLYGSLRLCHSETERLQDRYRDKMDRLKALIDRLREARAVLTRMEFGQRSHRRERPVSGCIRGQQPEAAGTGPNVTTPSLC